MSIAKLSNGTLFKVGDGAGSENFTTVPETMRVSGPSTRFDLLDVTSHDSAGLFREYIPGLSDGDRVRAEINWRPGNAVHIALRTAQYNATNRNFKIVFPDTPSNTVLMSTYIERMEPTADVGQVMKSAIDLKITGAPAWS